MKYKDYMNKDYRFDKSTYIGILCLIIVISGLFGWLYEFIFYYFDSGMKEFFNRGSNFLPWINIYAIGALIIFFLTYKKRKSPLYVFIVSMISTGIFEYIIGYFLEHIIKTKYWDYSNEILNFGNINGYVCLRSILVFGLAALLLIYVIVPLCFKLALKMKKRNFLILSYTIGSIFIIDTLYNIIFADILNLKKATDIYKSIGIKYKHFN